MQLVADGMEPFDGASPPFCKACVEGKHHRRPFTSSTNRATKLLQRVCSDVCGPWPVQSISGARYFVTFIDEFSSFTVVYAIARKDQVFKCFKDYHAYVERETGCQLKCLRTDGGGEYMSTNFDAYLSAHGIACETTIPDTPQQNGKAERYNRTITENVRTILADTKLPRFLWAELVATVVYLRNRSPSTTTPDSTPYEYFYGRRPNVSHLREIGCRVFAYVNKKHRDKLGARAIECRLVGYAEIFGQKGYRIWDVKGKRMLSSTSVRFDDISTTSPSPAPSPQSSAVPATSPAPPPTTSTPPDPPPLRRSRRQPKPHQDPDFVYLSVTGEPTSATEVYGLPEAEKGIWVAAMLGELNSLKQRETWEVVDMVDGVNVVDSKWVFKTKLCADGTVERHKARLVARGFTQSHGLDYDETFAPVAQLRSLRLLLAIATANQWPIHQIDVKNAYLQGQLHHTIYMRPPRDSERLFGIGPKHILRLRRPLYGLKQGAHEWNATFDTVLKNIGLTPLLMDPCVYVNADRTTIVGIYVDDGVIAGRDVEKYKKLLGEQFDITDGGSLTWFMGMKISSQSDGSRRIDQQQYIERALKRFGLDLCNPASTPAVTTTIPTPLAADTDATDSTFYRRFIGTLIWLANGTRPDIAFSVHCMARFMERPTSAHHTAVKRIFRYLRHTATLGITFHPGNLQLRGYSDSDWAGDLTSRKSTYGYVFLLNGTSVSWQSKLQSVTAHSPLEAEYITLNEAAREAKWLQQFLAQLVNTPLAPIPISYDNQGAGQLVFNGSSTQRTKHIDVKYHGTRDFIKNNIIAISHIPSTQNAADILTKALPEPLFVKHRRNLGVC